MARDKRKAGPITRGYRRTLQGISIAAGLLCICLLIVYWYFVGRHWKVGDTTELWGQFGDFIGGVIGTVVAAATLALVAITVLLQVRVMNLAKRQLDESKKELKLTRDEMRISNDALRQQTFEATFFRLLEQFRDYAMTIHYDGVSGPDAFSRWASMIKKGYVKQASSTEARQRAAAAYGQLYSGEARWLGPYFRMLYHLHKLIHKSGLNDDRRAQYASMVRAQLSEPELVLLFYNLLDDRSRNMRPYVNYYGMLKHLNRELLMEPSHGDHDFFAPEMAFRDYEWRKAHGVRPNPEIGP